MWHTVKISALYRKLLDNLRSICTRFRNLIAGLVVKYQRIYLLLITLAVIMGYAFTLMFPALIIYSILNLNDIILDSSSISWPSVTIWGVVLLCSVIFTFRYIRSIPELPVGAILSDEKMPEIYELIQQFKSHYKRPTIHRVIITPNYELDIIKTPRWAWPVWTVNTLVIGLPVLLCHSPKQFQCLLARRMGQFSRHNNFLTNWLYQHRAIWRQYQLVYAKQKQLDSMPMKWFFAIYAPFYETVSVFVARRDELNADAYALEVFNDDEVREAITAEMVCRWILEKRFWPTVIKVAGNNKKAMLSPYRKMAATVHANLKGNKLDLIIENIFSSNPFPEDPVPSLQQRIENIGHKKPYMPESDGDTAAKYYLGPLEKNVIDFIERIWKKKPGHLGSN